MKFLTFSAGLDDRDSFEEKGLIPANVHPALISSWQRSREYNVSPFIDSAPSVPYEPRDDIESLLVKFAKPYFDYFRSLSLSSECVFGLSNSSGVIVHVETESQNIKKYMEKHNFMVNALWREDSVGTNAISMALKEETNIFLYGYNHYSYGWHPYCCTASPIFHPQSGQVIGAVDLTSFCNELHIHSMGWVTAMARLIEAGLSTHFLKNAGNNKTTMNTTRFPVTKNPVMKNPPLNVIGKDPAFLFALKLAEKAAKTDLNILLTGETGTGKEVFARAIHNTSTRNMGPFVAVNCGAIPKELMASEFFGYSEGAFTGASRRGHPGRFEQADGGTILLDEIGDAPMELQIGLLRVLEEGCVHRLGAVRPTPVNVRILAATSRDLNSLVQNGSFRKDLYYRLSGVNINIPSLRERVEDIPLLAENFLAEIKEKTDCNSIISEELMQSFMSYNWPGNVRELKYTVERLVRLAEDTVLGNELFYQLMPQKTVSTFKNNHTGRNNNNKSPEFDVSSLKVSPKRDALIGAMNEAMGCVSKIADKMGVSRSTVYRRMKKYGIEIK